METGRYAGGIRRMVGVMGEGRDRHRDKPCEWEALAARRERGGSEGEGRGGEGQVINRGSGGATSEMKRDCGLTSPEKAKRTPLAAATGNCTASRTGQLRSAL